MDPWDIRLEGKRFMKTSVLAQTSFTLRVSSKFCRLLMIFANSLDPDQAQSSGSKRFDTLTVPERTF